MRRRCYLCEHHVVINDANPFEEATVNDIAVLCKLVPNAYKTDRSQYPSDHAEFMAITVSCDPADLHKEARALEWCPLGCEVDTIPNQTKKVSVVPEKDECTIKKGAIKAEEIRQEPVIKKQKEKPVHKQQIVVAPEIKTGKIIS